MSDFFEEEMFEERPVEAEPEPVEEPPQRRRRRGGDVEKPRRRSKRRGRKQARGGGDEPRKPKRKLGGGGGETTRRILIAIPAIVFAVAITVVGDWVFALAMIAIGILCLREYLELTSTARPLAIPAYAAVAAMVVAAHVGTSYSVLMVFAASFPLLFAFGANAKHRDGVTMSIAVTLLGIVWIGIPLAHAVLLRDLPNHGAALLIDVLVGTFVTDTAAYATGRMFGSHKLAPNLSPNKSIEGLIGGFVIGTMGFWFAGLYQNWLSGADALIIGAAVAAVAPVGDLFESMLKRDLGKKDTGTIFGPHGGILDRLDAVFFTVVVGYYLAVALVY
ncbi:MAG: phosphatidate cytidylyltransferase [Solirubrobacterales bacterium]|jgi:phosphatidate cytidylyltransferase|nr:phosphatidate cytidylyltransferase [Solirubrobacterales bacterium]